MKLVALISLSSRGTAKPLFYLRFGNRLALYLLSMLVAVPLHAATPLVIQYEGRVTVDGTAHNGPGFFKFALVDGGTILWDNDPSDGSTQLPGNGTVAPVEAVVTQGRFSVPLGDTSLANMGALDPTDFLENDNIVLRVWFSADNIVFNELTPAQRLQAVPYALVARTSETVVNRSVSDAGLAPGIAVPVGGIIMWWGGVEAIPEGFEICDGAAPVTPGATLTVNKPDLVSRFPKGAEPNESSLGDLNQGGAASVTGTTAAVAAPLPRHRHYVNITENTSESGEHTHFVGGRSFTSSGGSEFVPYGDPDGTVQYFAESDPAGKHRHTVSVTGWSDYTPSTGSTSPTHSHPFSVETMPPFQEVFYIIRVK